MGGKVLDGLAHYFTFGCHVFVVRVPVLQIPCQDLDDVDGAVRFYNRLALISWRFPLTVYCGHSWSLTVFGTVEMKLG